MQRLVMLRAVVMFCLIIAVISVYRTGIPLHFSAISFGIAMLGGLCLFAWWRLHYKIIISERELLLQLLGDIAVFTLIFYFSGGYSNPFIWMYILPITVAAVALCAVHAWCIAMMSVTCYTVLIFYHIPLSHLHMHTYSGVNLDIHLVGMWLGFVMSAVIIAIFINRIGQNLRNYDKQMAEVRERALESERMLALGTLAASAAHELGTPLATMAVVSKELMQDLHDQPENISQLQMISTQIQRCKEILSSISQNAGYGRAEAGGMVPLDVFLQQTLQRWRDIRPATQITVTISSTNAPHIFVDRALAQAIQNLLDNAADESQEQILFDAEWDESILRIDIRDFGKGLNEAIKQEIGTPFFSSKNENGMGLGVYLTQTILARYNGKVSLNNHPQGGVLTHIDLPLAQLKVEKA